MTDSPWRLRRIALAWSLIASCTVSAAAAQDKPASGARRAASEARSGAEPMEGSFAATLAIIEKNSLKKVARRRLMESAVNGMLHDLDPYSRYLGPEEWRRLNTALAGKFGGIGVFLDIDAAARRLRVKYLLAGSSGAEAGMDAGDQILEINGRSTKDLPLDQVLEVLPGPVGSEVRLLILHPGAAEPVRLAVERRTVKTPSVRAGHRDDQGRWDYLEDPAHGIGYMRILRLAEDTVDDMKAALTALESRNLRGLILDLRENTGGLTAAAIAAADLFLDSGRILTVTDADGKESFYDARPGSYTAFPMAVLINDHTASAAEILSAALQDHQRAVFVGRKSFGKGYMQKLFPLGDNAGGITLTIASYRRPSGRNLDRHAAPNGSDEWGVSPDEGMHVAVEGAEYDEWLKDYQFKDISIDPKSALLTENRPANARDRVLERAFEVLLERIRS